MSARAIIIVMAAALMAPTACDRKQGGPPSAASSANDQPVAALPSTGVPPNTGAAANIAPTIALRGDSADAPVRISCSDKITCTGLVAVAPDGTVTLEATSFPAGAAVRVEDGEPQPLVGNQSRVIVPIARHILGQSVEALKINDSIDVVFTVDAQDATPGVYELHLAGARAAGALAMLGAPGAAQPSAAGSRAPARSVLLLGWHSMVLGAAEHVGDVDLVAIATVTKHRKGHCGPYAGTGGAMSIDRGTDDVAIVVADRRSGAHVASRTFKGSPVLGCPGEISLGGPADPDPTALAIGVPDEASVRAWLATLIGG